MQKYIFCFVTLSFLAQAMEPNGLGNKCVQWLFFAQHVAKNNVRITAQDRFELAKILEKNGCKQIEGEVKRADIMHYQNLGAIVTCPVAHTPCKFTFTLGHKS